MFIYASVAYIAPVNGFAHFQITSPYPHRCVFFCIRKHYETDKVEMFGVAPPAAYTAPNLYITRAITCRYKSHRQIKFWRDSLASINSGIQPGETAVTRTCVRPLVLSFPPFLSPCSSLSFTFLLFLSLARFLLSSSFFSIALVTHGYLSFYTPDGQVLLPLHARTVRDYLVRASMRTFFFAN